VEGVPAHVMGAGIRPKPFYASVIFQNLFVSVVYFVVLPGFHQNKMFMSYSSLPETEVDFSRKAIFKFYRHLQDQRCFNLISCSTV